MNEETIDLSLFSWLNQPENVDIGADYLEFSTQPETDFWQRTHYGVRRNNGHAYLTHLWDDFSFSIRAEFFYESAYDQCGLLLYLDENNWARASAVFIDETYSLLGSVVTSAGYSDWAATAVTPDSNRMFYRVSRRGADFRLDCSRNGDDYNQMRIFHLHGDLTLARVGIYACSPGNSSFKVRFNEFAVGPSAWSD